MEQILDILKDIHPLLAIIGLLVSGIIGFFIKENSRLKLEIKDLRTEYTNEIKENIRHYVEISSLIRQFIDKGDIKEIQNKINELINAVNIINNTLNYLQNRLNGLGKNG